MDKNKKIIIISFLMFILVILVFSIISINRIMKNKELENETTYIVIEQFLDLKGTNRKVIYKTEFTKELKYDEEIESIIVPGRHNRVIIENGICKVLNSTCPNHICENHEIKSTTKWFEAAISDISCLPNGLYIYITTEAE